MREQLERAEFAETIAKGWVQLNQEKIRRADEIEHQLVMWARDIARLAGDNSAFLKTWDRINWRGEEAIRLASVPRSSPVTLNPDMPMNATIAWKTIEAFVYTLETHPDAIGQRIIIRLDGKPGQWASAIDEQTLQRMPPRLVEDMGRGIAEQLANYIRRDGRTKAA